MIILNSRITKMMLTTHIAFSVGWFGTVAAFLVLSIFGISGNEPIVKACYISMDLIAWFIVLPFCLCSLLTGLVHALFTSWGLFKHYWIVVKLVLTLIATIVLLAHMQPITYLAKVATETPLTLSELTQLRIRLIADAGAAMFVLLATTAISIYKPWGKIPAELSLPKFQSPEKKPYGIYLLIGFVIVLLLFIALHMMSGGMTHH